MLGPPNDDCGVDEIFGYREQYLDNGEPLYRTSSHPIAGDE